MGRFMEGHLLEVSRVMIIVPELIFYGLFQKNIVEVV